MNKKIFIAIIASISLFTIMTCTQKTTKLQPIKCENGKWGYALNGNIVIPCKYDEVVDWSFENGYSRVMLNGKYGVIDSTGFEIVPVQYDNIDKIYEDYDFSSFNFWKGTIKDKMVLIDKSGREITPYYQQLFGFVNGFAIVKLNNKYGFIDTTGVEVIPCKYDDARHFSEGLAAVNIGGTNDNGKTFGGWGFIDETGKEVIALKFNAHNEGAPCFSDGRAEVTLIEQEESLTGFIDKTGKFLSDFPIKRKSVSVPFHAEETISYTAIKAFDDGKIISILFYLAINGDKKQISKLTINIERKPDKKTINGYDIKVNEDGFFSHNLFNGNIKGTVESDKIVGTFIGEDNTSFSFTATQ